MEIIVVAPEIYSKTARGLTHYISKKKGYKAAYWTVKQYQHNEFQIGGQRYVIFVGDTKENEVTRDYVEFIKLVHSKGGVCYGYDGQKALVYGKGDLKDKNEFSEVFNTINFTTAPVVFIGTLGILAPILLVPFAYLGAIIISLIVKKIIKIKEVKKLKLLQTQTAADAFINNEFDKWIQSEC